MRDNIFIDNPGHLEANANYYQKVMQYIHDGVLVTNHKGQILSVNPAFLKIFEINETDVSEMLKSPSGYFTLINPDPQNFSLMEWPFARMNKGEAFEDENYIFIRKGTEKKILVSCTSLPQKNKNDDNFTSAILVVHDRSGQVDSELPNIREISSSPGKLSKLVNYKERLNEEKQLLQTIIDTIPVMITIYSEKVKSIIFNNAFVQLTGWTREDVKHKSIMELAYPDPETRNMVHQFVESLEPEFKDFIIRTKDGRDLETSWANVKLPDGRQVGVGIDISSRKKMEKELILARKKAEKENYIQYAFIQNISHEVRTPMNSILGFAELLQKSMTGSKEKKFLEAIAFNGMQLLRLIDDIIDFSRLDKNEMSLSRENIIVGSFIKQVEKQLNGLKKTYRKKFLTTRVNVPQEIREMNIKTDVYRLQQVLTNLISNAIKYTNEGSVEIGCETCGDPKFIKFFVKDSGIGIKEADHSKVFERFNRFHSQSENEFRGTGLGLAISKQLITLLGGEIGFESKSGKGSVFYFTHPLMEQTNEFSDTDSKKEKKVDQVPDLEGKSVLITEDDKFSYMMMFHMLEETKAKVFHAEDGFEALEILQENDIDILFLDIRLPRLNGYQVIKKLRLLKNDLPVIAQTASALQEDREKIKNAGFDYHAVKPISQKEMFNILNRFL